MEPSIRSASPPRRSFEILPPEIRNLIYEYLLGRRTVHLAWGLPRRSQKPRIYGYQGVDPLSLWESWDYTYSFVDYTLLSRSSLPGQDPDPELRKLPLEVFRVSKAIHAEAAGIFYTTNDFVFYEPAILHKFVKDYPTYNPLLRRVTLCLWGGWFPYSQYFFEKMVRTCFVDMTALSHVRLFVEVEVRDLSRVVEKDWRLKTAVESLLYIRRFCGRGELAAHFRAIQRSNARMECQRNKLDLIRGVWENGLAEISPEAQKEEGMRIAKPRERKTDVSDENKKENIQSEKAGGDNLAMQFALPPRKTSNPPPYSRPSRSTIQRRNELRTTAVLGCAIISILFLVYYMSASNVPTAVSDVSSVSGASDKTKVIIVTVLDDDTYGSEYTQRVKENREDYAKRHGYTNFFTNVKSYIPYLENHPKSWAIIPAVRNAMTQYPSGTHFFHLSQHALIMDPTISLKSHIYDKKRLESLMLKDIPIVPPDSVIKTLSHLKEEDVDLIITQDGESLVPGSFIMKKSEWATFLLDAWFDPLYRSYNFKHAEAHALDHIAQWHPTVLSKTVLLPQRIMNSYGTHASTPSKDGTYKDGDFLIHFSGCNMDPKRDCSKEMSPYWSKWLRLKDKV